MIERLFRGKRVWSKGKSSGRPLAVPQHCDPLVQMLYQEMIVQQVKVGLVEQRAGLGAGTIENWTRHSPILPNIEAAWNVLGYTLQPKEIK